MIQTVISALNEGFVQTLKLFVVTLVGSIPLGLVICFGSMSRWAPLGFLGRKYFLRARRCSGRPRTVKLRASRAGSWAPRRRGPV